MATSKTNNQSFIKDALALCLITLVAGALLGFVYELTKGPIEEAKLKEKLSAYESVFPEAADFAEDEAVKAAVTSEAYTNALAAAGVDRAGCFRQCDWLCDGHGFDQRLFRADFYQRRH